MLLLFLPLNPPQARREFGSMCFMMCHASILPPGNSHQSFHSPYPRCVAKIRPCSSKITAATTSTVFIFNFYCNDGFVIMVQRYCFFLTYARVCKKRDPEGSLSVLAVVGCVVLITAHFPRLHTPRTCTKTAF